MNELDSRLIENGVVFLPWVGSLYGTGYQNRRLMILGESHYNEWSGQRHTLSYNMTKECVLETINREEGSTFWKYIEQAILNEYRTDGWAPSGGKVLWEKLAFYNFVQKAVEGGPRKAPTWEQFQSSQAPFRAVLEELRPDLVWVCGKRLWWSMEKRDEDTFHQLVGVYHLRDGHKVQCVATNHCSSGAFSWSKVHQVLAASLINQNYAVEMCSELWPNHRRARVPALLGS